MSTRKRYNKKHLVKNVSKKKNKKTKKQRGGFICQIPNVINVQKSYFNKSNDIKVNSEAYDIYIKECEKYSSCVFENINNFDLIMKILQIIKELANKDTTLKYKGIIDTSNENYNNKGNLSRRISDNIITQNEILLNSKFLDIYVTYLLESYFNSDFTDSNTSFLHKLDRDFIIDEDTILAKNLIISTLINLDDRLLIKSIIQILSNTFKIIIKDKYLLKDHAVYFTKSLTTLNNHDLANTASNIIFVSIIQLFLYSFSNYINTLNVEEKATKSYTILCLIYKIVFSYLTKSIESYAENSDTYLLPFLNDEKLSKFIIGTNFDNIENLPIFTHLVNTFTIFDCVIKNFLKPERLDILCTELDGYLTKNRPFNRLKDHNFLMEGCITNILLQGWSIELVKEIYNYMSSKKV